MTTTHTVVHDDPLRRLAVEHGAFLRREVLELGLDDRDLRRQVRAGAWIRVRHGAYTFSDLWAAMDPDERHRVRTRAAMRVLGQRVVVSHHSACVMHRLPVWGADLERVQLTRRDGGAGRKEGDLQHREGFVVASDVCEVDGVAVMTPVRAVLEAASLLTVEQGLAVVDAGLNRRLYDAERLASQLELMQSWPGCRRLQLVVRMADGRSGSVAESRCRYLFWRWGLPAPELQYEVTSEGVLVGICDFVWPDLGLIVEFDGKGKYLKHLRPGETPGDAVFREKRREDALRRVTGWRVIRLTWADLEHPERVAGLLRAALAA